MPALWGGRDGGNLTRSLLDLGFPAAMLMISGAGLPLQHRRPASHPLSVPRLAATSPGACAGCVATNLGAPTPL